MPLDDQSYFLRRTREEEAAARAATNPVVRARHQEFASVYRMRLQYLDRETKGEPSPIVVIPEDEAFIEAPASISDHPVPSIEILVR